MSYTFSRRNFMKYTALAAAAVAADGKGVFRQTIRILSGDLRTENST